LVSAQQATADSRPITKLESRRLPSLVVTKRALSQLAGILHLQAYPSGGPPPKLPLDELWFWTTPHSTYVRGLCVADDVTIKFAPIGTDNAGANTKVAANGIEAKAYYHFVQAPDRLNEEMSQSERHAQDAKCASLDPEKDMTLWAQDEDDAVEEYRLISDLIRDSHSSPRPFELDCSKYYDGESKCASDLAAVALKDVNSINRCESPNTDVTCWVFDLTAGQDYLELQLFVQSIPGAQVIVKVVPHEQVVIADQKED
jgi:hypothetical protein